MSDDDQLRVCPGGHSITHPAPALRNDEYLCRGCVRHAERTLGDLPAAVSELERTIARLAKIGGGRRGKGSEQPLGANIETAQKGDTILALLYEWADFVAQRYKDTSLPLRGVPRRNMTFRAVALLLRGKRFLHTDIQGPALATALQSIRHDLNRLVDRPPERWYAGPCKEPLDYDKSLGYTCQSRLYATPNQPEIQCDGWRQENSGCGATHTATARREWLIDYLENELVSIDDTLAALPTLLPHYPKPRRDSVLGWVRSGRLIAKGHNDIGEDTFVGGELMTLIQAYKPHTYAPRQKRKSA